MHVLLQEAKVKLNDIESGLYRLETKRSWVGKLNTNILEGKVKSENLQRLGARLES